MNIWQKIISSLLALILIFIMISFLLPSKIQIQTKTTIQAPHEIVHRQITHPRHWYNWIAWFQHSGSLDLKFEGYPTGAGSVIIWKNANNFPDGQVLIYKISFDSIYTFLNIHRVGFGNLNFSVKSIKPNVTELDCSYSVETGFNPFQRYFVFFNQKKLESQITNSISELKIISEKIASKIKPHTLESYPSFDQ